MMSLADNPPAKQEDYHGPEESGATGAANQLGNSDGVWPLIQTILDEHNSAEPKRHRRVGLRRVFKGIICHLRTGYQWNQLPKPFGDDSTVRRDFQLWCQRGLLARLWAVLVQTCDTLGRVDWQWQAADTAMGKARKGGDLVGGNSTDRRQKRWRRLVVDETGSLLDASIAGANVHDTKLLAATLGVIVVEHPQPTEEYPQYLCLDKGDDNPTGHETVATYQDTPYIRRIGEEKLDPHGQKISPARRWVVERTLAWLSKYRGLLLRYEKKAISFLGLLQLACARLWMRR